MEVKDFNLRMYAQELATVMQSNMQTSMNEIVAVSQLGTSLLKGGLNQNLYVNKSWQLNAIDLILNESTHYNNCKNIHTGLEA